MVTGQFADKPTRSQ